MRIYKINKPKALQIPNRLQFNTLKNGQGDSGYIAGIVTENSLPVSRRVMCYHRLTGAWLATTFSDDDGKYRFNGLVAGVKYFVTSLDENEDSTQYNAVTQDLITASEVTA